MRFLVCHSEMDGTTEPLIAVIGHPIAGNPSQFALERALHSVDLDWRVLSFDVRPEDVAAALAGFAVTGIIGVLIDDSLSTAAKEWCHQNDIVQSGDGKTSPDCLSRDEQNQFAASSEGNAWLEQQIADSEGDRVWLGAGELPSCLDPEQWRQVDEPFDDGSSAKSATVLAFDSGFARSEKSFAELDLSDWPEDSKKIFVDFCGDNSFANEISGLGHRRITPLELQIGTVQQCVKRWAKVSCSAEVIRDAIEEYFGL